MEGPRRHYHWRWPGWSMLLAVAALSSICGCRGANLTIPFDHINSEVIYHAEVNDRVIVKSAAGATLTSEIVDDPSKCQVSPAPEDPASGADGATVDDVVIAGPEREVNEAKDGVPVADEIVKAESEDEDNDGVHVAHVVKPGVAPFLGAKSAGDSHKKHAHKVHTAIAVGRMLICATQSNDNGKATTKLLTVDVENANEGVHHRGGHHHHSKSHDHGPPHHHHGHHGARHRDNTTGIGPNAKKANQTAHVRAVTLPAEIGKPSGEKVATPGKEKVGTPSREKVRVSHPTGGIDPHPWATHPGDDAPIGIINAENEKAVAEVREADIAAAGRALEVGTQESPAKTTQVCMCM